jgi:hypothetical protein
VNVVMEDALGGPPTVNDAGMWTDAYALTYPVLADVDSSWSDAYLAEKANFATFLIDEEGVILWRELGEEVETFDRAAEQVRHHMGAPSR